MIPLLLGPVVGFLVAFWSHWYQKRKEFAEQTYINIAHRALTIGALPGFILGLLLGVGIAIASTEYQRIEVRVLEKLPITVPNDNDHFLGMFGKEPGQYFFWDASRQEFRFLRGKNVSVHEEDRVGAVLEIFIDVIPPSYQWWALQPTSRDVTTFHIRIPKGTLLTIRGYESGSRVIRF